MDSPVGSAGTTGARVLSGAVAEANKPASPGAWTGSIVRIFNARTIVGAGFLFSESQLLTCAHVVAYALGEDAREDQPDPPSGVIHLDFPHVEPGRLLTARVTRWIPARDAASSSMHGAEDVAVLTLHEDPPEQSQPAPLLARGDLWNQSYGAFGFPEGQEEGVWATGVFRAGQARGWIQIDAVTSTGFSITRGFSGTPVLDTGGEGVLGMVVGAEQRSSVRAAYMIPASQLIDIVTDSLPTADLDFDTEQVPSVAAFYGRERDVARYRERLRRNRFVLIQGQVGVGKTALGVKLARELATDEQIFWCTFDSIEKKTTDALWWCLAGFLRRRGRANLWRHLRGAERAQAVSLELTARMNRLLKDVESGGFVICIDDVHLAGDDPDLVQSIELLGDRYTDRLAELPVHFILMARSFPDRVARLVGAVLSEFTADEVRAYLVDEHHIELSDHYLERLVSLTGGNPKLVDLMIPVMTSLMGKFTAIEAFLGGGLPRDSEYIAREMYETLTDDEQAIVTAVAIFEKQVDQHLIESIAESAGVTYPELRIDSLVDRRILLRPADGNVSCPSPLREYSNRIVPSFQRVTLHDRAADYYERTHNYLAAAFHLRKAEMHHESIRALVEHSEVLIGGGGAAALLRALEDVDETSLGADEWSNLSRVRGDALRMLGSYEKALVAYRSARDAAVTDEKRLELECEIGSTYERLGKDQEALDHFLTTLKADQTGAKTGALANLVHQVGWANYRLGHWSEANTYLQQGLELAQHIGDPRLLGQSQERLGMVALAMGRLKEAEDYLERSITTYRRTADRNREARARANLAMVYGRKGDRAQQLEQYRMVETIFADVGDIDGLMRLYNNMGYLLSHDLQDHRAGIAYYEKLTDLSASIRQERFLSVAHAGLAESLLGLGETEAALQSAERARQVAETAGDLLTQGLAWRVHGRIRLEIGELTGARRAFRRSIQFLKRAHNEAAARELVEARAGYAQVWQRVRQGGLRAAARDLAGFSVGEVVEAIKSAGGQTR